MRNWNQKYFPALPAGKKGFQPTYEELKQYLQAECPYRDICFQPTYEELKQQSLKNYVEMICGFQPTYEELKPRYISRVYRP